jgi:hypothetical protein
MFRYFFKLLDESGEPTDTAIEFTEDVLNASKLAQSLDINNYASGIYKSTRVVLDLENSSGRYSDTSESASIFIASRANTIVEIYYTSSPEKAICGFAICGGYNAYLDDVDTTTRQNIVFRGVLVEDAITNSSGEKVLKLAAIGFDHLLDRYFTTGAIAGQSTDFNFNFILTDAAANTFINYSAADLNADISYVTDLVDVAKQTTALNALKKLLEDTNSILRVRYSDDNVEVRSRDPNPTLAYSFYGPNSDFGAENILRIDSFSEGLNRVINTAAWKDLATPNINIDASSVAVYGTYYKKFTSDLILDASTAKQDTVMNAALAEFAFPKREMWLTTHATYETSLLDLFDRVAVGFDDYAVLTNSSGTWDFAIIGEDVYSGSAGSIFIEEGTEFKILAKEIDLKADTVRLYLREI